MTLCFVLSIMVRTDESYNLSIKGRGNKTDPAINSSTHAELWAYIYMHMMCVVALVACMLGYKLVLCSNEWMNKLKNMANVHYNRDCLATAINTVLKVTSYNTANPTINTVPHIITWS